MSERTLWLCLCALVASGLFLSSCDKDEPEQEPQEQEQEQTEQEPAPVLTVNTPVTMTYEGGACSFSYSIANPVDGADLSCSADVSWISEIDVSTSGTVGFTVAQNATGQLRTGNITLIYTYNDGYVSKKVGVVQYGSTPVLTIQPSAVIPDCLGGAYEFGYTIDDEFLGGDLSCKADVKWLGDFDCSTYGTVLFTVDENESDELRSGEITVTYSCGSVTVSATVSVVQEYGNALSRLVGTYTASGAAYYDVGIAREKSWTLRIFEDGDSWVIIDGMVPYAVGSYPGTEALLAKGYLNADGQLVIYSQFTDYIQTSTGLNLGYVPCIEYNEGVSFVADLTGSDVKFTYVSRTGVWESDYGIFLGGFTSRDFGYFEGFLDVVAPVPVMQLKKISSDPSYTGGEVAGVSLWSECSSEEEIFKKLESIELHTDFMNKPLGR